MKYFFILLLVSFSGTAIFAQDSSFQKMIDFSRPGSNHTLLGSLSGTWSFQDAKLSFVKGTLVRKPIYNGRFYTVEITGGKLKVPVADGKMIEEKLSGNAN